MWAAVLLAILAAATAACADEELFTVRGKLLWPEETVSSAAGIKLILSTHGAPQRYAWPQPDGAFVMHGVLAGSHMLDVAAIGLIYPQLRLDVSAKGGGRVLATFADNSLQRLPEPLIIRPLARADYFEKRTPFNVIAFLKSPYGLMIMFGLAAVFLLPMLKVDPEEYKELMQQAAPSATPAISAGRSGGQQARSRR